MEGLIKRLSVSMVAATILLFTGSLAWSQEIPSPVCYAIRSYVGQIDKAQKASMSTDDFRTSSMLNYARMQLDLAYNQYRHQIPSEYRVNITTSADELLRDLIKGGSSEDRLGVQSRLLGLCPGG